MKKLYITYGVLLVSLTLLNNLLCMEEMENGTKLSELSSNQENKDKDDISFFKQKFNALRRSSVDNPSDYKSFVSEMQKKNLETRSILFNIVFLKKVKTIKKIQKEWNITKENAEFFVGLCLDEMTNNVKKQGDRFQYRIQSPLDLQQLAETQTFKDLASKYLELCPSNSVTIRFDNSRNCTHPEKNDPDQKGTLSFGPFSNNFIMQLSNQFFTNTPEQQEFTMAHESSHLILCHHYFDTLLAKYCADSIVLEYYNVSMPSFREWLYRDEKIDWQKLNQIFHDNPDDAPVLTDIISDSDSFMALSRALEYEADSLFALLKGLSTAKILERGLAKMVEEGKTSEEKPKGKTHPLPEKRWRLMATIVKILEAQQALTSDAETKED